ncbi:MAG: HNH endonuclease [Candidatus Firestonebacteria bacterium]
MKKKNKSIKDLLIEYFKLHPKEDMSHGPVVDWVETKYKKLYNKKPRDTWRAIRNLHEVGFLIKVKKGVYKYDPKAVNQRDLEDFTSKQKEFILKRDGYKCVRCGRGKEDGIELQVDHIKSRYEGGKAIIENGQTLCSQHNFIKKHLKQTETGKKMFIRLYELAKSEKNKELIYFCDDVLKDYEKHNINGHIIWER